MFEIVPGLQIAEREIQIDFVRASGPGGQNVNKVATAAQLRFDVQGSGSLPAEVRERLLKLAGKRITAEGILILDARRFRTQEANRADAIQRFIELVRKATVRPKPRRRTRPTQASMEARLKLKKERSAIKKSRRSRTEDP